MRINTSIENSQISLKNIELEFDNAGIYIISGENGSGKSSIIKNIVFEEKNIEFSDEKIKDLFRKDRGQVIGYVEQDPIEYDISLIKYLVRYSRRTDMNKLKTYIKQFGLDHLSLRRKITKLSGGELTKANIIASLLKDTPYLFLDEPTNNLDNESVRQFVKVIAEYSKNHAVIIVSHDPRMNFQDITEYEINNNKVIKKSEASKEKKAVIANDNRTFSLAKVVTDYIFSYNGVMSFVVILLSLFALAFVEYIFYYSTMSTEKDIHIRDIIVGYKADEQYDELNKTYAGAQNIEVEEEKIFQMIYHRDLVELLEDERIEDILLPDVKYIDEMNDVLDNEENIPDKIMLFSIPKVIVDNFDGQVTLPHNALMLKNGRLPKDGAMEVTISEKLLEKFYGINQETAIGTIIDINGLSYTVVGIGYRDIAIVSYDEGVDYGYFSLKNNIKKLDELEKYYIENEYYLTNGSSDEIFIIKKGYEGVVLDYLVKNYPAENYASDKFENVFMAVINAKADRLLMIISVVGTLIIIVINIVINRSKRKIYINKAISIDNYHCRKNYTLNMYRKIDYMTYCVCAVLIGISVCFKFNEIFKYCILSLVSGAIILLVQFVGVKHE